MTITQHDLQLHAGTLLERVRLGESLTVLHDGLPIAELRPIAAPTPQQRPRGRCAGQFRVPDDFDAPLPEEIVQGFEGR